MIKIELNLIYIFQPIIFAVLLQVDDRIGRCMGVMGNDSIRVL
jgi:hypothetical protein